MFEDLSPMNPAIMQMLEAWAPGPRQQADMLRLDEIHKAFEDANAVGAKSPWELGGPGFVAALMMGGSALGGAFSGAGSAGAAAARPDLGALISGGMGPQAALASPLTIGSATPAILGGAAGLAPSAGLAAGATEMLGEGGPLAGLPGGVEDVVKGGGAGFLDKLFGNTALGDWLGVGASALGGALQARSEGQAAESMNPWNINGLFGSAAFDPGSRTASFTADPLTAALRAQLGQSAQGFLGGAGTNPFLQFSQGLGNEALPGLFGGVQNALGNLPSGAFDAFQSQMGDARNIASQDVNGLINNRLSLLRQQAAPQEEQAYNSLQQKLFGQGRLGSTGGANQMQAFARGLGEADLSRQLAAQGLGLQAQGMNLNQAGMLSGLAGQNFSAALNYNDIGANRAMQRMQNAMNLFGFGNQLQQQQMQSGIGGLTGLMGLDQNMMNSVALGRNIAAPWQQAQLGSSSPLAGLLGGIGRMAGLYDKTKEG